MDASTNTPVGPMGNQNGPTYVVKSAKSTSLPCLILLQIVKMPAIQY